MLSMIRRHSTDTLIWEYLDGEITPKRASRLSRVLSVKPAVRQRFVESAVMHGMLYAYYRDEQIGEDIFTPMSDTPRRRAGKSPAA